MKKSAKAFRKTLRNQGAFYTPQAIAMKMRAQLPEHVAEVYDPTCGGYWSKRDSRSWRRNFEKERKGI